MRVSHRLKEIVALAGLYGPMRRLVGSRKVKAARSNMTQLISRLLPPGALVFDIGANVGSFSEVYALAGCRVLAVEPNPDCVRQIKLVYDGLSIKTFQAAVGPTCGIATLHISKNWDATSTLSSDWMDRMQDWDERYKENWNREEQVPLVTLDTLIEYFGRPDYIKLDVEGYEFRALSGLSWQLPVLSFKFHNASLEQTLNCLNSPIFSKGSSFNLIVNPSWGYHEQFESPRWISKDELLLVLSSYMNGNAEGDVFVKSEDDWTTCPRLMNSLI
jgi:FkbM family methyltransferase